MAYYYFEHKNLSKEVKEGIRSIYKQYGEKYESFALNNLKNHFTNLDITNSMKSRFCLKTKKEWKD